MAEGYPLILEQYQPDDIPASQESLLADIEARRAIAMPDHTILYRFGKAGQAMVVFGIGNGIGHHSHNPDSPVTQLMADAWIEWMTATEAAPESRIVVNEGGTRGPYEGNTPWHVAMVKGAEQGFFAHAAQVDAIPVIDGEPPCGEDIHAAAALPGVDVTDVVRFLALRYSRQLAQQGYTTSLMAEFLNRAIPRTCRMLNENPDSKFKDFVFSFKAFAADYEEEYGHPFSIADWQFHLDETVTRVYYPDKFGGEPESKVTMVGHRVNQKRDENYDELLQKLWTKGFSPFFPVGEPHAWPLESSLAGLGMRNPHFDQYQRITPRGIRQAIAKIVSPEVRAARLKAHDAWTTRYYTTGPGSPDTPPEYLI